ncbi:polysaccharide pyruvyl transferase family protein [Conexibacter woesei]|uniref:polysaccharide pyruvyl transferase family protein n=1 Tax=Conexibacter woesei TaxID=191495 RepID=UPI000419BCB3|nr:polysaccharide pyruvyl transferase family protein [Conexibacter woesei]
MTSAAPDPLAVQPLDEAYRSLVAPGTPIALLDFPLYPNVGDSAIWLGAAALAQRNGNTIKYTANHASYSAAGLRRCLPEDGVIVVQGGGNFGDRWPAHHQLRERVVSDFPDRPVVFLPISVEFLSAEAAERSFALLAAHPRLHVMVRDRASCATVEQALPGRTRLTPDAATALGHLDAGAAAPAHDVVALVRTDSEAQARVPAPPAGLDVRVIDWLNVPGQDGYDPAFRRSEWALQRLGSVLVRVPAIAPPGHQSLVLAAYMRMARRRLAWGVRVLASGRVVATDRLHAHIICELLGRRHVVADSGHGKISGYVATHGQSATSTLVAPAELYDAVARELAR